MGKRILRPSGEHYFTILDDLKRATLSRLVADGFAPCAVVETSPSNFLAWLRHSQVFPKALSSFAARTLATRYEAHTSAGDWLRFGRLPGLTNRKPIHRNPAGCFPLVRLIGSTGCVYTRLTRSPSGFPSFTSSRSSSAAYAGRALSPSRVPDIHPLSQDK